MSPLMIFRQAAKADYQKLSRVVLSKQNELQFQHFFSTKPDPKTKVETKIAKYSAVEEASRSNVRGYLFGRFYDYIKNYDSLIEKRYPKATQAYRVLMLGVKNFFNDMKRFIKITQIAKTSDDGLRALNRSEIECYYNLPKDMFKIAPVLLISALPFMNYVILPVAYKWPRILLSQHFWTPQQKSAFQIAYMRERLIYNKPVYRLLQAQMNTLKKAPAETSGYEQMQGIFGHLGSGTHPSPEEIINVKGVFSKTPYSLESLGARHLTYLCHLYSLHTWPGKYGRLAERSYLVHHMDLAINREGGAHNMSTKDLQESCFIRGLNPNNLPDDEMIEYLRKWTQVSTTVDAESVSLFLHLPILLAYNHPNNWVLIH